MKRTTSAVAVKLFKIFSKNNNVLIFGHEQGVYENKNKYTGCFF